MSMVAPDLQNSRSHALVRRRRRYVFAGMLLGCLGLVSLVVGSAQAQVSWYDNLDSVEPHLQLRQGTAPVQVLVHRKDNQDSQHGSAAERIVLRCPAGHSAPLAIPIPRAPVIQEFRADCWIKCNRPGVQLAAKVVLPRSISPTTSQPGSSTIPGGSL